MELRAIVRRSPRVRRANAPLAGKSDSNLTHPLPHPRARAACRVSAHSSLPGSGDEPGSRCTVLVRHQGATRHSTLHFKSAGPRLEMTLTSCLINAISNSNRRKTQFLNPPWRARTFFRNLPYPGPVRDFGSMLTEFLGWAAATNGSRLGFDKRERESAFQRAVHLESNSGAWVQ